MESYLSKKANRKSLKLFLFVKLAYKGSDILPHKEHNVSELKMTQNFYLQMDSFEVEAVSLGHLKRIIIGHDGTGPGKLDGYLKQLKLK